MKLGLGLFFAVCVVLAAAFADASQKGFHSADQLTPTEIAKVF